MLTRNKKHKGSSIVSNETADSLPPERCRICLKPGEIPIFGEEDISQQVMEFGGIEIHYFDNLPQHLCTSCHSLLESAKLFRKTAKQTEEILNNRTFKDGASEMSDDFDYKSMDMHVSSDSDSCIEREYLEYDNISEPASDTELKFEPDFETESLANTIKSEPEDEEANDNKVEMKLIKVKQDADEESNIDNELVMIIVSDKDKAKNLSLSCGECDMKFNSQEELQKHQTDTHPEDQEQCEICHKNVDKSVYKQHIKEHREKYKKGQQKKYAKVECEVCGKKVSKSYHKYHMKMHGTPKEQAERNAECPICKKTFTVNYFSDHMRRVHNKDIKCQPMPIILKKEKPPQDESLSKCPVCDRMVSKSSYKEHLAKHGGPNRVYICDQCGREFKHPSAFKTHVLTHGSELKYQCQFCPYRGLHLGLLKIHVRTHTGDYNYKCPECPARFITKSNLSKHLQRHKGLCNYKCDTCNKGFYSKRDVDKHIKTVHLELKNNICKICGKGFGHRDNMLSHQLKVHKIKRVTDRRGRIPSYLKQDQKKSSDEE